MSTTPAFPSSKESGIREPVRGDSATLSSRVRRGALWSVLSTLLLRFSNIAVTAVVAHILAPRDFGIFTVALTAYTVISSLGELGIASCLIRADLDIDAIAPTMVTVSWTTSALFASGMAIFARHIAVALGSVDGAEPIRVMALAVLISGVFAVPGAQLTRDFKQDKLFLANVISLVPSTALLLLLAKSGSGAMAFAWSRVAAQLVMGFIMAVSVPKFYAPGIDRGALSVLARFGFPLAGANFINFVLLNVDYAFVGHLIGAVALGAYVLAFTVASSPGLLLGTVINNVSMPAFSRVKQDPELLKQAMISGLRAVSLVLLPMCSLMLVLARPLVLTLYGAKWAASAEVLSILSLYGAVSIICVLFANMLTSLGKARLILFVQLFWLGALVPAMAIGVHRDGIVGAAMAHIVVISPIVLPGYLFVLRRETGIRLTLLGRAILPPLLAAAVAAFAAKETAARFASPPLQLAGGLVAGCLVYLVAALPQATILLGQQHAARLRAVPVFRLYEAMARLLRLPGRGADSELAAAFGHAVSETAVSPSPSGRSYGYESKEPDKPSAGDAVRVAAVGQGFTGMSDLAADALTVPFRIPWSYRVPEAPSAPVAVPDVARKVRLPVAAAQIRERPARRRVTLVWSLLVLDVLTYYGSLIHVPSAAGKALTQGALPAALLVALTLNRRVIIRPNVFLCLVSLLVVEAIITALQPQHVGTVYRTFRLAEFVVTLWLLSPWWGRRDLLLVRCHLGALVTILGTVFLGMLVAPGRALSGHRLNGVLWAIPATQVAHYAAVTAGLVVVLWLGGHLSGRVTSLVGLTATGMLILTHTRTALVGLVAGIVVAGLSLILIKARARKFFAGAGVLAAGALLTLSGVITSWLARGEGAQQLSNLTGRTKVWGPLLSFPRDRFQEIFGFGLSNSSFNGLPIDSNWLASYHEQGFIGVVICAAILLFLLVTAFFQPRGVPRALALFLVTYCLVASFTEVGFTDASMYLLDLTLAASLVVSLPAGQLPNTGWRD
jgi:lipopolysaccharide exporter